MTWLPRLPSSFPKHYSEALEKAVANPGAPVFFAQFHSDANARYIAERFRYFRWCLRQRPASERLTALEANWRFRLSRDPSGILYLTAFSNDSLEALNPHLAEILQSVVD